MSTITYRANLSAKSFPMIASNWGRTVIVPQYDNTFNRQLTSNEDVDKDAGIPQIYYCHNVLPHQQGFQSIGYLQIINNTADAYSFNQVFFIKDSSDNRTYLSIKSDGSWYVLNSTADAWVFKVTRAVGNVTVATVNGTTYIYLANVGCWTYNFGTGTFTSVTLTSLTPANILGIATSSGYLIAWTSNTVAWSSSIDPTDFTPSLTTGAGSGQVQGAAGPITLCFSHLFGFIIYTTGNAVVALFSGNAKYPFNLREIPSTGGVSSPNLVAFESNSGNHYAYTTSGVQLVSVSQSQTVFPEVTDFVAGKLFEDYDTTTDTFSTIILSTTMVKQFTTISDRYFVISYGVLSLTHALVYDISSKRWGKLKIPHAVCFEFQIPNAQITEAPRQSIAFLQASGNVQVVDFNTSSPNHSGFILLGKYQFVRPRTLQMNEINVEDIRAPSNFQLSVHSALDGKNTVVTYPTLLYSNGLFQKYGSRAEGINHAIGLKGTFSVVSLVLNFCIGGKR